MHAPDNPLNDPRLRAVLAHDARTQLAFFRRSLNAQGRFDTLDHDGTPVPGQPQELHATTRMVHAYAMAKLWGEPDCDAIIDAGMACLWTRHRDRLHGGYVWGLSQAGVSDATKLAYGHVFVLLAASSALAAGHEDAERLLSDVEQIIAQHFLEPDTGLLADDFARDWAPFSDYRGMNANMHGVEAMLAAFEATGSEIYLQRAGRILDFFTAQMAPVHGWRIPEHYTSGWQVDPDYAGNPMFRPSGTTPGHSLEFARLLLHHWDLAGRPGSDAVTRARALVETALADAWLPQGGIAYTLDLQGRVDVADRYWWPVTEAIGAMAALLKCDPQPRDADWYRRLWDFAQAHFIDHDRGGWFPEIDAAGAPVSHQFTGKPDIYHALQADLLPLLPGLSRPMQELAALGAA